MKTRTRNPEIRNRLEFRISNFEFPARSAGGGGNRARTGDPELAKLVLYQLSYAPRPQFRGSPTSAHNLRQLSLTMLRSGTGAIRLPMQDDVVPRYGSHRTKPSR